MTAPNNLPIATNGSADVPIGQDDQDAATAILRLCLGRPVSGEVERRIDMLDDWKLLYGFIGETALDQRQGMPARWIDDQSRRNLSQDRAAVMRRALESGNPDEPDVPDELRPFRLSILSALELQRSVFRMEWLVKQVLVADQPAILAAPKKGMKTTIAVDLSISLALGDSFLGRFEVPTPVRVLLLSGESGGFVIQDTVRRICAFKGTDPEMLEGMFFVAFTLPQLSSQEHLDEIARVIRENEIKVILIDPLYLCLISSGGRRIDPANLFDMGPLFAAIAKTCLDAGATPILIHHFKKGGTGAQFEEPELEDMAYAGIQEFARQWILLGRRKPYESGSGLHEMWLKTGGSAGHGGCWALDIREGVMDDNFRGRFWNPSIRPVDEVRVETQAQGRANTTERQQEQARAKDAAKAKLLEEDAVSALAMLATLGKATQTHWRNSMPRWNGERMGPVVAFLERSHQIRKTTLEVPSGRSGTRLVEGWEPAPDAGDFLTESMGACP